MTSQWDSIDCSCRGEQHGPEWSFLVYLSIYLSVCLSICLSISLSIYLSIYMFGSNNSSQSLDDELPRWKKNNVTLWKQKRQLRIPRKTAAWGMFHSHSERIAAAAWQIQYLHKYAGIGPTKCQQTILSLLVGFSSTGSLIIFFDACFSFCPFGFCFRLSLKSRYAYGTPVFELVSFNSCPPNLQCRWLERAWVGAEGRGRSF